jgi:hypothetical protein
MISKKLHNFLIMYNVLNYISNIFGLYFYVYKHIFDFE